MGRRSEPERENPDLLTQDGVSGGIEGLPTKVDRYAKAKKTALDVADYIGGSEHSQPLAKQVRRLLDCGNYLVFRHYFTLDQVKLHGASLCMQHLLCPLCAIRRGAKFLKAYLDRWELIRADSPHLKPYLVTLTVKDGPDLAERFYHLKKCQQELWMRKHRGRGSPLDGVAGAVWSYEIKRGSGSGEWHPHLHMIALAENLQVEGAGNHGPLSSEWHNITGDSFMVDVRPIDELDPVSGFIEVFKYAVKFSSQSPADTVHAFQTLRGKRLLASSGCFRGVPEPEGLLDDSEALEGLPFVTLFYRYLVGKGYTL
jgi:plasmid rolling circle replication initiator protein Rep